MRTLEDKVLLSWTAKNGAFENINVIHIKCAHVKKVVVFPHCVCMFSSILVWTEKIGCENGSVDLNI